MKRLLCLILLASLLLSGCQLLGDRIKEPVNFYYVRRDYREDLTAAISPEEREASGHREDLSYLMALYLMGPVSEQLESPLPSGTRVYVEIHSKNNVTLNLTDTEKIMTDAQFSLACACLSQTCLEITGTKQVVINSGSRSVTMTRENLALSDNLTVDTTEETP